MFDTSMDISFSVSCWEIFNCIKDLYNCTWNGECDETSPGVVFFGTLTRTRYVHFITRWYEPVPAQGCGDDTIVSTGNSSGLPRIEITVLLGYFGDFNITFFSNQSLQDCLECFECIAVYEYEVLKEEVVECLEEQITEDLRDGSSQYHWESELMGNCLY